MRQPPDCSDGIRFRFRMKSDPTIAIALLRSRMDDYLFVYGTLRQGFAHPMAAWLATVASPMGSARFAGRLLDLGRYPAVVPAPGGASWVLGDLFRITHASALWPRLDRYEGCTDSGDPSNEYRRERVRVLGPGDVPYQAWIYLYNQPTDGLNAIASGDYLRR